MTFRDTRCCLLALVLAAIAVPGTPARAEEKKLQQVNLDNFEDEPRDWKFIGGQEFPGAKGGLVRDNSTVHAGKGAYRLDADFSGGGLYVGTWKDLNEFSLAGLKELRCWIKSAGVSKIGIRILDGTDQCHQKKNIPINTNGEWQELVLVVKDLVGEEHWGGANDGKWHGTVRGFGINIGKDGIVESAGAKGSLWIDDITAKVAPPGVPTLLSCVLSQPACRPAYGLTITYRWNAEPMSKDYQAFVHFIGPDGKKAFQGDHELPVPASEWSGPVEYKKTLVAPTNAALGTYKIMVGLWDPKASGPTWDRQVLKLGEGVVPDNGNNDDARNRYQVGTFEMTADAPIPKLPAPTLKLDNYKMTFEETFNGPLSVSAWGPGTRWIAHTPYAGDFGDARFGEPGADSPFSIENGLLKIEALKDANGKWRAGLLSSVDTKGEGFSQKFGYFEMRAKFPKGPGTWPAFWLLGVPQLKEPKDRKTITQIEIDVVEQYGVMPNNLCTTLHLWYANGKHWGRGENFIVDGMAENFHTYGVMVEEDFTTFYFDGVELRKEKTLEEAKVPLYLLVDLAMGGGWPIDQAPSPSNMYVDYVRAYARK